MYWKYENKINSIDNCNDLMKLFDALDNEYKDDCKAQDECFRNIVNREYNRIKGLICKKADGLKCDYCDILRLQILDF